MATEYERLMTEEEKRRAERERRWERISHEMEREARVRLDAIGRAMSISAVIDEVKLAKHKFKGYIDTIRRDLPEYVDDAIASVTFYLSDIWSKGRERITEIYDKLVGEESVYTKPT
jgi:hypothetical protein